jgi:two-component system, cell cycle sensor histidine kinase and response regulator CckA
VKNPLPDGDSDEPAPDDSGQALAQQALAHDFSNLLTAIICAADAVLERPGLDPETRADLVHIREGADRGTALVSRIRDPAAGASHISLNEMIRATSRLLAHRLGSRITLTLTLSEPDAEVKMDAAMLDRVLLNLIANARHAMRAGGEVTLTTEPRTLARPETRIPDSIAAGDYMVIAVADTGAGMPKSQVPEIFNPGFSTRQRSGGSGLGLLSVRDIVHQCAGFLAVESVEGQGTRFEIYLPRSPGKAPAGVVDRRIATAPRTVLLVEDDPLVSRIAERVLHRAGWTVLCAGSAEDALELLRQSACDLMISDVAMPGMDGLALTRLVLIGRPDLPVILTSGYEHVAADHEFQTARVEFLTKPYGRDDLLAAVGRVAERRKGRSSTP